MQPRERLLAALRRQPIDRVPLVLEGLTFSSRAAIDAHPDPGRREVAHRIHTNLAFPVLWPTHANRYLVTPPQRMRTVQSEARGGTERTTIEIDTPRGSLISVTERNTRTDTVWTVKYPVETREEITRIASIPWEMPEGLAAPAEDATGSEMDGRGYLQANVSSPLVCVGGMMPYQEFLALCATDLDLVVELTDVCAERIMAILDVLLARPGIEYLWIGGCEWLTPPMASGRLYERLVQPYEARIIARAHQAGVVCHVHCHGRVRSTLPLAVARGADFFEPMEPPPDGDITMAEGKTLAGGRLTLGGNVEARLLAYGEPDEIEAAVRQAFEGGRQGMVLQTTAGPLEAMSDRMVANYHRLIDTWEALSPI